MNRKCNRLEKILAPIYSIITREKTYLIWTVYVLFFGAINIFGLLIMGDFETLRKAFEEGSLIVFSISICAPFCADLFIELIVDRRKKKMSSFINYKIISGLMNILYIVLLSFLWIGNFHSNIVLQILIGLFSLVFSFYMYCVGKMDEHVEVFSKYENLEYAEEENDRIDSLNNKADDIESVQTDNGVVKL